ncbi:MAG TPA: MFS transporter [Candidatus Acidoferrum sp.]|nr:MFS transporter [Candidatus Acidoferrum sp.]
MSGERYRWAVVGMLWFVCFFNYADRQAIFSVFPVIKTEMRLSDTELGIIGSAFMWVYALSAPLAGLVADRFSRKSLILGGLLFWSAITLCTAFCTQYWQLVLVRALEGLGESFYFPASMSLIADYHGGGTRSRAMSLHQSSVYAGTIAGGSLAGYLGQYHGWRSSFYLFGWGGMALAMVLVAILREPKRGEADRMAEAPEVKDTRGIGASLRGVFAHPMAPVLMAVFVGANFVASVFLTWLPSFLVRKFAMNLSMAGFSSTAYLQIASVLGVLTGGLLADRMVRGRPGGRMLTQAIGLLCGVPFILLTGLTTTVAAVIAAMAGFGFFKGLYDANIWASLYDVVPPANRATALGVMNSIGWLGGGAAPVAIGYMSQSFGMSRSIAATSAIYLVVGLGLLAGMRRWVPAR